MEKHSDLISENSVLIKELAVKGEVNLYKISNPLDYELKNDIDSYDFTTVIIKMNRCNQDSSTKIVD